MSKKSRKQRQRQNYHPKHDFVKTLKAPQATQKSQTEPELKLAPVLADSPTIKIAGQKKDIMTTLIIASVIIGLFFVISVLNQKTQLLNETGATILNSLNLKL